MFLEAPPKRPKPSLLLLLSSGTCQSHWESLKLRGNDVPNNNNNNKNGFVYYGERSGDDNEVKSQKSLTKKKED